MTDQNVVLPKFGGVTLSHTPWLGVMHFEVCSVVPFPLDAEKGKCCCMSNKITIYFLIVGFKWCNLNVRPMVSFTVTEVQCEVTITLCAGKRKCCMRLVDKVEIFFLKVTSIGSN